jgi:WD40 repeat protein
MSSRTDLKTWFASLKKPTGTQFANLIDTFWSKDEDTITPPDVVGLSTLLNAKANQVDLEAVADGAQPRENQRLSTDNWVFFQKMSASEDISAPKLNLSKDGHIISIEAADLTTDRILTAPDQDGQIATTTNVTDAVNSEADSRIANDAATLASANAYTDSSLVSSVRFRGGWDASGGNYPATGGTGISGAIKSGNQFEVTVAGTMGGVAYAVGDLLTALVDAPGQTSTNWFASEHNTQQATESLRGNVRIADTTTANDETTTNDTDAITAKKLWGAFNHFKTIVTGTLGISVTGSAGSTSTWSGQQYINTDATAADVVMVKSAADGGVWRPANPSIIKTFLGLASSTLGTLLTGLGTPTAAAIAATDTILGAFGKLQSQITKIFTLVSGSTNNVAIGSTGVSVIPSQISIIDLVDGSYTANIVCDKESNTSTRVLAFLKTAGQLAVGITQDGLLKLYNLRTGNPSIVLSPDGSGYFTGSITGKTEADGDNTTKLASTEFVHKALVPMLAVVKTIDAFGVVNTNSDYTYAVDPTDTFHEMLSIGGVLKIATLSSTSITGIVTFYDLNGVLQTLNIVFRAGSATNANVNYTAPGATGYYHFFDMHFLAMANTTVSINFDLSGSTMTYTLNATLTRVRKIPV